MSKILFVVNKVNSTEGDINKVIQICDNITADNIDPLPSHVVSREQIIFGISNPLEGFEVRDSSVLLGHTMQENDDLWDKINTKQFNGNYAIFRSNPEEIEILSDILSTKSIWYYFDETQIVASTSQRAIIQYLESFSFNENVIPWILGNGLLGPNLSWDNRISRIPPDTVLKLNRNSWSMELISGDFNFKANQLSDRDNIQELEKRIRNSFSSINLDYSKWVLTLSGGYDSRGLICLLPKKDKFQNKLKTITWGVLSSKTDKFSDASVAKKIAEIFDLQNEYLLTDGTSESLEIILNRFLKNGEGRIDHIGGYMDGFEIWKKLFENETRGVIRGDEVFGSYNFISDFHLKQFVGLSTLSDYDNLKNNSYLMSINPAFPAEFEKKDEETFEMWRDRLYQTYLVPYFLSALSDLKISYVDQINPFLSRNIISWIRQMPDHLRTDKMGYKKVIKKVNPKVEFAKSSSTLGLKEILREKRMIDIIHRELSTENARSIFPNEFLLFLIDGTKDFTNKRSLNTENNFFALIKTYIPKWLKRKILKKTFTPHLDIYLLAFRAYIVVRMTTILGNEAKGFK